MTMEDDGGSDDGAEGPRFQSVRLLLCELWVYSR